VIPGVLAPPAPSAVTQHLQRGAIARATGIVVVALGLVAGAAWVGLVSPLSYRRWDLTNGGSQQLSIKEPGTYVLYEEYPGAAGSVAPPALELTVRSVSGRKVEITPLVDESTGVSPRTAAAPFPEGRAVGSFTVEKAGSFLVLASPSSRNASGLDDLDLMDTAHVAMSSDVPLGWIGNPAALLALTVAPVVVGGVLVLVGRRRARR
jgi:hypothetical protein